MSEQPSDDRKRRRRRRGRRRSARPASSASAPDSSTVADGAPRSASVGDASPGADSAPSAARKSRSRRRRKSPRGGAARRNSAPPALTREAAAPEPRVADVGTHRAAPEPATTPPSDTLDVDDVRDATATPTPRSARSVARDRATLETSAGGIVYRVQDGEPFFLLIRDSYRNWGFPKGHLEDGEAPEQAAVREVEEETGLGALRVDGAIETIDWFFRFRGKLVHKVCHFYLMRTHHRRTNPQRDEGITACRWVRFEDATKLISYANARAVLVRAHEMVQAESSRHARRPVRATTDEASRG